MTYSTLRAGSVIGNGRKLEHAIDTLSAALLRRPEVSMVGDAYDVRGPYIVVGVRSGPIPAPGRFDGFDVEFERADVVPFTQARSQLLSDFKLLASIPAHVPDTTKKVGFWYSKSEPNFPKAQDAVDRSWNPAERRTALAFMRKVPRGQQYRGWSDCRICGKHNGSCDMTDGVYTWPEGFAHYIEVHAVKPPQAFIDHCLGKRGLGSFWSDPIGTLVSGPGKLVDAAAGGPQQRRRAKAARDAAAATQKKIDEEKAARDAAVATTTAAAQQEVAATTAAAKAAAKKKLIKTLAIGGGAFAVLAIGLFLVTGKSEPAKAAT